MAQGIADVGGILGLARIIAQDGDALEYDLMSRCGMTLDDVPHRLSWRALASFVRNCDETTALFRRMHPEHYGWTREAYMLADLYDAITNSAAGVMRSNHVKVHSPKPYRRPKPITHKHGAVSVEDFEAGWAAAMERHRQQIKDQ